MLATIDLTRRQTARVLEQALRTRARVDLEARSGDLTLTGIIGSREGTLLCVVLQGGGGQSLAPLVGAFCDVRLVLSGHLYLFTTCIVDAVDNTTPQRLLLAIPELVQVANRRKFDRTALAEPVEVQIVAAGAYEPLVGTVMNVNPNALGCRLPRRQAEEQLLVDDEVRVRFRLPGEPAVLDLVAAVCVKTPAGDGADLDVGLEFCVPQPVETGQASLARLRAVLIRDYIGPSEAEGEP